MYKNSLEDTENAVGDHPALQFQPVRSGPAAIWSRIVARPQRYWAELIPPHVLGFFNLLVKSILSFCSLNTKLAQAKNKILPQNQKRKAKSMCSSLYSRSNVTKPPPLPQEVPFFAIPNIIMMHRPTVSSNTVLIK